MLNRKRVLTAILCLVFVMINTVMAQAITPYQSYNYSYSNGAGSDTPAPIAYLPYKQLDSEDIGAELSTPSDIVKDKDGNIYIINKDNGSIVILNSEWKLIRVIKNFIKDGKEDKFKRPEGLFVDEKGRIFVADTDNSRVVILDNEGNYISEFGKPESDVLKEDFKFNPRKLGMDKSGRIFIVSRGTYEGLMEMYEDGEFSGFIGSNPVKVDPVLLFWKSILSKE